MNDRNLLTAVPAACPDCGATYRVHPRNAGKRLRCRTGDCGGVVPVPAAETVPDVPPLVPVFSPGFYLPEDEPAPESIARGLPWWGISSVTVAAVAALVIVCIGAAGLIQAVNVIHQTRTAARLPSEPAESPRQAAPAIVAPPPIVAAPTQAVAVDAEDLYDEYEANEVAADNRWRGVDVEVTGIVKDIGKDIFGGPYVTFGVADNRFLTSVQAAFPRDSIVGLAMLRKGQTLTVRGRCTGKAFMSVYLKDCVLK